MPPGRTGNVSGTYYGLEMTPEEEALLYGAETAPPPPQGGGYATEPQGGNDVYYATDYADPNAPQYTIQDPAATAQPYQAQPTLPAPESAAYLPSTTPSSPTMDQRAANSYDPAGVLQDLYGPTPTQNGSTYIPASQRNNAGVDNIQSAPELNNRSQSVGDVVGSATNGAISNLFNWGAQGASAEGARESTALPGQVDRANQAVRDFNATAVSQGTPAGLPPAADMAWLDPSPFGWNPGHVPTEQERYDSGSSMTMNDTISQPAYIPEHPNQGPLAANSALGYGPLPQDAALPEVNISLPEKSKGGYFDAALDATTEANRKQNPASMLPGGRAIRRGANNAMPPLVPSDGPKQKTTPTTPATSATTPTAPKGPAFANVSPTNRLTDPSAVRSQMAGPTEAETARLNLEKDGLIDGKGNWTTDARTLLGPEGRGWLDANGNWTEQAVKDGAITSFSVGRPNWTGLIKLNEGAAVPEFDPANDPNATVPATSTSSDSGGSGWVDYGNSGGGSGWVDYGSRGGGGRSYSRGGGGGGGWSSGYSGGGGGFSGGGDMAAALAFLGDDFMGGRFKDMVESGAGGDMSWESFLEDMNGDGEFSASEIKAAKKKSKMRRGSRSRRSKPLSTSGRAASSSNKDTHTGIRRDILERVEGMTPKTGTKKKKSDG